jgi:hypothetical protein
MSTGKNREELSKVRKTSRGNEMKRKKTNIPDCSLDRKAREGEKIGVREVVGSEGQVSGTGTLHCSGRGGPTVTVVHHFRYSTG